MRRFVVVVLLFAASARAQDVLTVGAVHAQSGSTVQVPVYVRDAGGTTLGIDAGAGKRISGYALKVLYPSSQIASMSFARAGVAIVPAPLFETTFAASDYASAVASFSESNPISFTLNAAAPGNQIGTLTVTLQGALSVGTVIPLTIHAPTAMLSSQSGADRETIAGGNLTVVNGSITVTGTAPPANLVASPIGTTQVSVTWSAVSGADNYEVWRSVNGGAFASVSTPTGTTFNDMAVSAGTTYLYRVRAVSATNGFSGFSNTDAATLLAFTDEPLAIGTIVKATHFAETRTAVNAMRAAASLSPLASDPSVAVGQTVLAQHLTALRTGLDHARAAIGLSTLTYTDSVPTLIRAVHVQELRDGVE